MSAPEQIITDEQIIKVHAYANFGSMTPREVVNDGVRKYVVGYTGGSTQLSILREHGLITQPKPRSYRANLTEKGKSYARAIFTEAVFVKAELDAAVQAERARCAAIAEKTCASYPQKIIACGQSGDEFGEACYESALADCLTISAAIRKGEPT
jgi:hypothetical protein